MTNMRYATLALILPFAPSWQVLRPPETGLEAIFRKSWRKVGRMISIFHHFLKIWMDIPFLILTTIVYDIIYGDILYIGEDINVDDGVVFRWWWAWRHWACAKQGRVPDLKLNGEYRPSRERKDLGGTQWKVQRRQTTACLIIISCLLYTSDAADE